MQFYICRHGETDGNVNKIVQGSGIDMPLNDRGRAQAEKLKEIMSPLRLRVVYCSTMTRARQTAEIVASGMNARVEEIAGVQEIHYGDAEGMYNCDVEEKYKDILGIIRDENNPNFKTAHLPNAESVADSLERAYKAFNKLKREAKSDKAIIVMHGGIMYNIYYDQYGLKRSFANCDYFVLEW